MAGCSDLLQLLFATVDLKNRRCDVGVLCPAAAGYIKFDMRSRRYEIPLMAPQEDRRLPSNLSSEVTCCV